jgi:G3E family GTPase
MSGITPVTVLTGFLGSGKTTLLNRWVRDPRFADMAVLVNEWGDIPIDHALVRESSDRIVVLAGGCVCCRMAGDVVRALRELHFQRVEGAIPAFSRVVIETTGLADPGPLLATLIEMPMVAARYALAGVVAAVDAEHGEATLARHPEAVRQAAMADRIVVTKTDRADPSRVRALHERLARLNPGAPRVESVHGGADPLPLLEAGLYRGPGTKLDAAGWLSAGSYRRAGVPRTAHDASIAAFAWSGAEPRPWDDVETALETLLDLMGERILRLKGLVSVAGEPGPRAVHAVGHTLYPSARLPAWPDADRSTRIVLIGQGLDEAAAAKILDTFLAPSRSSR